MSASAPLDTAPLNPTPRLRQLAALAMLATVTIYGMNFVVSRHAVLNGFTPYDLAALRFGFAGLILLPLFLRSGGFQTCAGIGWGRGVVLAIMSGVPMSMFQMIGLSLAPAAHGATIGPGIVTVMSVVGGALLFGSRLTRPILIGLAIILLGLVFFGLGATTAPSGTILLGDLSFLLMALFWGGYPLVLQKWRVDALTATAVLSVISLVYLPVYWLFLPSNLAHIPLWLIALHAFNQAILNMIIGLWLWGWAARTTGAAQSGRFPPLIPVIGTLVAIPALGEWPGPYQTFAIVLIVAGLAVMAFRR